MKLELIEQWIRNHNPRGDLKLAVAADVSHGTVLNLLKGQENYSIETAKKLARTLGVGLDELCGMEHDEEPPAA